MFLKSSAPLLLSLLVTGHAVADEERWIDSITLGFGYSGASSDVTLSNGGVAGVADADSNGRGFAATMVFDYELQPRFSPYVDLASLIQDDRDFLIPSAGLRYRFSTEDGAIQPFFSAGAGYVFAEWNEPPVAGASSAEPSGQSFALSFQAGSDFHIAENLALNATLRYDLYDIGTTIVENSKVTTIEDKSSLSVLVGLTYRFGEKRLKDDDGDGVPNLRDECPGTIRGAPVDERGCALDSDKDGVIDLYDRCPDTLPGVPVNEAGCPHWKFEFNLQLEFDRFRLSDLVNLPVFDPVEFLNRHPEYHIRITGHTDNTGSENYNLALSKWRAESARDFLIEKGIAKERVSTRGKGASDPLFDNLTPENRAKNRRIFVEIYRPGMILTTDIEPVEVGAAAESGKEDSQ